MMMQAATEPMIRVAVETSGAVGSVTLGRGDMVLETTTFSAVRQHAVELLPTIDALCRKHHTPPDEIGEVYVSAGPGSFTGLRIGITFAKAIALGGRTRVVRVPTLDVIAQNALAMDRPPARLAVMLDAKRGRVYAAGFELALGAQPIYRRTIEPGEVTPADFLSRMPSGGAVVGEAVAFHREAVEDSGLAMLPEEHNRARAEIVYALGRKRATAGRYDEPSTLTPIYIRRPEAEEVYERRHGKTSG